MKGTLLPLVFLLLISAIPHPRLLAQSAPIYDIVINGGRVIDPETKLDARRSIGIIGGTIAIITPKRLLGKRTINATGWVVAPGFIDLHSGGQSIAADRMQVFDGVTTALELDGGVSDVKSWYDTQAQTGRVLNYGVAAGGKTNDMNALEQALRAGAPGIGIDSFSRETLQPVYALAAKYKVPVFQHAGGTAANIPQLITLSAATGTNMHLCYTGNDMENVKQLVLQAQVKGVPVTLATHTFSPYDTVSAAALLAATSSTGGGNSIRYPIYLDKNRGQENTNTSYPNEALILSANTVIASGSQPWVDVTTGTPVDTFLWPLSLYAAAPPCSAGTYTRLLGYWVRDRKALSLSDAISKSSLLPARILEKSVPAMRKKGRLQKGMDADLIVFDPGTVRSMANATHPYRPAAGMKLVLVNGATVISNGELELSRPGQPIVRK